jgi:hypothetical protein
MESWAEKRNVPTDGKLSGTGRDCSGAADPLHNQFKRTLIREKASELETRARLCPARGHQIISMYLIIFIYVYVMLAATVAGGARKPGV